MFNGNSDGSDKEEIKLGENIYIIDYSFLGEEDEEEDGEESDEFVDAFDNEKDLNYYN